MRCLPVKATSGQTPKNCGWGSTTNGELEARVAADQEGATLVIADGPCRTIATPKGRLYSWWAM